MRANLSNPPDDLRDGPQEAAEFIADVPSQPSRDQSSLPQDDQAGNDQRARQQADAELAAALGSSEISVADEARAAENPALPDTSTGTHS